MAYPEKFEKFWKAYPRKVSKPAAAKAWEKNGVEEDMYLAQAAIDDVEKRSRLKYWPRDKTKIPHPATWINAHRWEDEGWEDEIGSGDDHVPVTKHYEQPAEPTRDWQWYELVLNRLGRNYILQASGLPETDTLLNTRDELIAQDVPAFVEEVNGEAMTIKQACIELGQLFLRHLDHAYRLSIGVTVFKKSLLPESARNTEKAL